MKDYAIVVGHTADSKGACSNLGLPCEWDYNMQVANKLADVADIYTHKTYAKGYTSMVKETASRLNAHNYKVVIFLHYNSAGPTATGCEVLYYYKSTKGAAYAKILNDLVSSRMNMRNRGAKPLSNNDRGYGEVYYPKAVALIAEPFFGSNAADVAKFSGCGIDTYANVIKEFLKGVN